MTTATHSPVFKRLSAKRIATAEARLERLRAISNLTFLRYENYCRLPSGKDDWTAPWGHITRADGDVSYGDMKEDDFPESAETYLRALSTDDCESGELYFYVPIASYSDYSGSTVEAGNYKWFVDNYGGHEFVFTAHGGFDTTAACVGLTGLLTCDDSVADTMLDALEGLEDYPCFNEEALSELESENSNVAWDSWVASDFRRALEKRHDGVEFEWGSDSDLRSFFEECADRANEYWYNEGYGPDMYIDVDKVIAGITLADLADHIIYAVVTFCDCGMEREVYNSETEAIDRIDALREKGIFGHYDLLPGAELPARSPGGPRLPLVFDE